MQFAENRDRVGQGFGHFTPVSDFVNGFLVLKHQPQLKNAADYPGSATSGFENPMSAKRMSFGTLLFRCATSLGNVVSGQTQ